MGGLLVVRRIDGRCDVELVGLGQVDGLGASRNLIVVSMSVLGRFWSVFSMVRVRDSCLAWVSIRGAL